MCMVDDGEPWAVYHETTPKARKATKCTECAREIAAGETYQRVEGCTRGEGWATFRMCVHCRAAAEWLVKVCDGYPIGFVRDDLDAHYGEYKDEWLLAQLDGMKRKWRAADGALMPLPELPANLSRYGA